MGDMGDIYRMMKEDSKERKTNNFEKSTKLLQNKGIEFESKNGGYHLIVEQEYDFYPSTGLFICRKTKKKGRGVRNLLKKIDKK